MIKPVSRHPAPDASVRAGRFSLWFSVVSRALSQQMVLFARRELGLNLAEYRALSMLAECRSASIRDIALAAQLDKAQTTRAVAVLTRRGLAIHTVDGRDRRLRIVKLTRAGCAMAAKTIPFAIERQRRMEQVLTPSELRTLWKTLTILSEEAQSMLADESGVKKPRGKTL